MSDIKSFLYVLKKFGYPNPKIKTLAKMTGYNLNDFLLDLKNELGEDGVEDFCKKTISKLQGKKGIEVNLNADGVEYAIVKLFPQYYDKDESENDIVVKYEIVDSKILSQDEDGNDVYKTIPQIRDEIGMGEWGDFDEMMDFVSMKVYDYVWERCGFGLWWQ